MPLFFIIHVVKKLKYFIIYIVETLKNKNNSLCIVVYVFIDLILIDFNIQVYEEKIEERNGDIEFETKKIKFGTLLKQFIENPEIKSTIKSGVRDLNIRSNFQRYYVWNIKKTTLLIESISLGIPLPILYLAEENDG